MQPASFIIILATAVSGVFADGCWDRNIGDVWTSMSDPSYGGCAWYTCLGDGKILKAKDCGAGGCSGAFYRCD
jgi:hypothetical protein